MKKNLLRIALFILALIAFYYFGYNKANSTFSAIDTQQEIPQKVLKVLEHVDKYDSAPEGYVGGRKFGNYEKLLPAKNNTHKINYKEWDVNPKVKGKNRGAERLVTGDDKSAYFTKDHYKSFKQIR